MVFRIYSGSLNRGIGFVELIVVIAMIAILTLIAFPYYKSIQENHALDMAASQIIQDIRKAQEYALSSRIDASGNFPVGGYGIYFNKTSNSTEYVIFADRATPSAPSGDKKRANNGTEDIETIKVEEGVKIQDLAQNAIHAIFLPPDPQVFLTNSSGSALVGTDAEIKVCLISNSSKCRVIKVNVAGLIWKD